MKVRGRYRDFAILETPTLGALTRGSRVATNVYEVLKAARGKQVLFFPARFDAHEVQAADGYAYQVAVQLFNQNYGKSLSAYVSTDAQGDWWGGAGGGTVAHAAIACFLGDTAEATMAFAATRPAEIPRIALVDFRNDCVGTSLQVIRTMFRRYLELLRGRPAGGGAASTSCSACARTPPPTCATSRCRRSATSGSTAASTRGWCSRCARRSTASGRAGASPARTARSPSSYCRDVQDRGHRRLHPGARSASSRSCGCPPTSTASAPGCSRRCDVCGTNNDFTADVVRVRIEGRWYDLAKVGRRACDNLHAGAGHARSAARSAGSRGHRRGRMNETVSLFTAFVAGLCRSSRPACCRSCPATCRSSAASTSPSCKDDRRRRPASRAASASPSSSSCSASRRCS